VIESEFGPESEPETELDELLLDQDEDPDPETRPW
jgi:hypothetical protein